MACTAKGVQRVTLSKFKPMSARMDMVPWAGAYALAISFVASSDSGFAWPLLVLVAALHALCHLFEVWSVRWYHRMRCDPVSAGPGSE